MSYLRYAADSDLYVLAAAGGGFLCFNCLLRPRATPEQFEAAADGAGLDALMHEPLKSAEKVLEHFDAHRAAGHKVPDRAYANIHAAARGLR